MGARQLEIRASIKNVTVRLGDADTTLGILAHSFLKEVALPLEADEVHPRKGVFDVVETGLVKGDEEAIGAELDVRQHHAGVHANQPDRESSGDELLLNLDGFLEGNPCQFCGDLLDTLRRDAAALGHSLR